MTPTRQAPEPLMSLPRDISAPRRMIQTAGFTLIELLVVTATLSLLISLLLPALSSARSSARATACASAVRQLALANDLYASDHAERFAPGAAGITTTNLHRWHGTRPTTAAPFSPESAPLTPYLGDDARISTALRQCPEFAGPRSDAADPNAFERSAGGYGYNNAFVGTSRRPRPQTGDASGTRVWDIETDRAGARRSMFRRPTTTAAFGDAALAADSVIEYSFLEPVFWPEFPGSRPDPSTHFRHPPRKGGSANIAWIDGHVSGETMTHSQSATVYTLDPEAHLIGWFGESESNRAFEP
jgi:prepilin-type processing-associated H-X9-DG protein